MVGERVKEARMILVSFVAVCVVLMVLLAWATVRYTSDMHTIGPETVTLEPGDWIEIPISPQFEWYEVRFQLEMECTDELDVVVVHGTHSIEGAMAQHYNNKSVNDPDYASTVVSTGDWREHILLECDCGCMMIIDNTPAGRVNQTDGPVRIGYELRWTEHRSEFFTLPFISLILVAVSLPVGMVVLWKRYQVAKIQEEVSREDTDAGPPG